MRKVLVEVYVPAAGQQHDFFLPCHLMLHEVLEMVGKAAADLSGGLFKNDAETVLCNRADGAILNLNASVAELKLQNGAQLMLV